jgi:hypothetical protein
VWREGPLLVSDTIGAPGNRVLKPLTGADEVPYVPLVGARLLSGKKGLSGSSECQITWSGFRP